MHSLTFLQRDSVRYPEWDLQICGHYRQLHLCSLHRHHQDHSHLPGLLRPRLRRSGSSKAAWNPGENPVLKSQTPAASRPQPQYSYWESFFGKSVSLNWMERQGRKATLCELCLWVCNGDTIKNLENLSGCLREPVVAFYSLCKLLRLPSISVTSYRTSVCHFVFIIYCPSSTHTHTPTHSCCSNIYFMWGLCKRKINMRWNVSVLERWCSSCYHVVLWVHSLLEKKERART